MNNKHYDVASITKKDKWKTQKRKNEAKNWLKWRILSLYPFRILSPYPFRILSVDLLRSASASAF
jgi:hypothetical protein